MTSFCKKKHSKMMFVHLKGGIDGDHIKLALEPEAASFWCQQVNVGKGLAFSKTGSKYMVVDLGGTYYYVKVLCNMYYIIHF